MFINKHQYSINNDKKLLHKVGKQWVVVSVMMLGLLGGVSVASHSVKASVNTPAIDRVTSKSADQSSASQVSNNNAQSTQALNTNSKSNVNRTVNSQSNNVSSNSNDSQVSNQNQISRSSQSSSKDSQLVNQANSANAQEAVANSPVVGRGHPGHGHHVDTNSYRGLNYRYNQATKALEFTGGHLNADNTVGLLNNSTFNGVGNGNNVVQSVKFDNGIDFSRLHNMAYTFTDDTGLKSVDLGNMDTGNVTTMQSAFAGDTNLKSVKLGNNFDTTHANQNGLFNNDNNLSSINISSPRTILKSNADLPGTWYQVTTTPFTSGTSTNLVDNRNHEGDWTVDKNVNSSYRGLNYHYNQTTGALEFTGGHLSADNTVGLLNTPVFNGVGNGNNAVKTVKFDNGVDFSGLRNMAYTFTDDTGLKSVDLGNMDTSNVTTMQDMFAGDTNLKSVKLGNNFDTTHANQDGLFSNDSNLSSINISSPNTVFNSSSNLPGTWYQLISSPVTANTSTNLVDNRNHEGNWTVNKVIGSNYRGLNYRYNQATGNVEFTSGHLSADNTVGLLNTPVFNGFGNGNNAIKSVTFDPGIDFSGLRNMAYTFTDDTGLKSINLGNMDTSNVTTMQNAFAGDTNLESIKLGNNFDTTHANQDGLFNNDNALSSINISSPQTLFNSDADLSGDWYNNGNNANLMDGQSHTGTWSTNRNQVSGYTLLHLHYILSHNNDMSGAYYEDNDDVSVPFSGRVGQEVDLAQTLPSYTRPGYNLISYNGSPMGPFKFALTSADAPKGNNNNFTPSYDVYFLNSNSNEVPAEGNKVSGQTTLTLNYVSSSNGKVAGSHKDKTTTVTLPFSSHVGETANLVSNLTPYIEPGYHLVSYNNSITQPVNFNLTSVDAPNGDNTNFKPNYSVYLLRNINSTPVNPSPAPNPNPNPAPAGTVSGKTTLHLHYVDNGVDNPTDTQIPFSGHVGQTVTLVDNLFSYDRDGYSLVSHNGSPTGPIKFALTSADAPNGSNTNFNPSYDIYFTKDNSPIPNTPDNPTPSTPTTPTGNLVSGHTTLNVHYLDSNDNQVGEINPQIPFSSYVGQVATLVSRDQIESYAQPGYNLVDHNGSPMGPIQFNLTSADAPKGANTSFDPTYDVYFKSNSANTPINPQMNNNNVVAGNAILRLHYILSHNGQLSGKFGEQDEVKYIPYSSHVNQNAVFTNDVTQYNKPGYHIISVADSNGKGSQTAGGISFTFDWEDAPRCNNYNFDPSYDLYYISNNGCPNPTPIVPTGNQVSGITTVRAHFLNSDGVETDSENHPVPFSSYVGQKATLVTANQIASFGRPGYNLVDRDGSPMGPIQFNLTSVDAPSGPNNSFDPTYDVYFKSNGTNNNVPVSPSNNVSTGNQVSGHPILNVYYLDANGNTVSSLTNQQAPEFTGYVGQRATVVSQDTLNSYGKPGYNIISRNGSQTGPIQFDLTSADAPDGDNDNFTPSYDLYFQNNGSVPDVPVTPAGNQVSGHPILTFKYLDGNGNVTSSSAPINGHSFSGNVGRNVTVINNDDLNLGNQAGYTLTSYNGSPVSPTQFTLTSVDAPNGANDKFDPQYTIYYKPVGVSAVESTANPVETSTESSNKPAASLKVSYFDADNGKIVGYQNYSADSNSMKLPAGYHQMKGVNLQRAGKYVLVAVEPNQVAK